MGRISSTVMPSTVAFLLAELLLLSSSSVHSFVQAPPRSCSDVSSTVMFADFPRPKSPAELRAEMAPEGKGPTPFDDKILDDIQEMLTILEDRVDGGPGCLSMSQVEEFQAMGQRVLADMNEKEASRLADVSQDQKSPSSQESSPAVADAGRRMGGSSYGQSRDYAQGPPPGAAGAGQGMAGSPNGQSSDFTRGPPPGRAGSSNGQVQGYTRGPPPGRAGSSNGQVEGYTRGPPPGRAGSSNGQVEGYTRGPPPGRDGSSNGQAQDYTRGAPPGRAGTSNVQHYTPGPSAGADRARDVSPYGQVRDSIQGPPPGAAGASRGRDVSPYGQVRDYAQKQSRSVAAGGRRTVSLHGQPRRTPEQKVRDTSNDEAPAHEGVGGFGLAKGTTNTYVIPGMDEMTPEEYQKELQASISARQRERQSKGRYGNRATWDYLNHLSGESGVLKDSEYD